MSKRRKQSMSDNVLRTEEEVLDYMVDGNNNEVVDGNADILENPEEFLLIGDKPSFTLDDEPEEILVPAPLSHKHCDQEKLPTAIEIVNGILKNCSINNKHKLIEISKLETTYPEHLTSKDFLPYFSLVAKLKSYNDVMSPKSKPTNYLQPEFGASKNYDLFNTLKTTINENSYKEFKCRFDIVNLIFLTYKSEAYSEVNLQRFDRYWKLGHTSTSLRTYQCLASIISRLCDISTRKKNIKTISLPVVVDVIKAEINESGRRNLTQYYKVK